ncbi:MAG: helix-turn-helix transcriptional regulator [Cyanobacteria bacterium J06626_4]
MATPLVLNQWKDVFLSGSVSDSQLFHADDSDQILVCPPHFGQGYIQKIPLAEDLTLVIHDFTLNQDVVIAPQRKSKHLKFEFQITGFNAGYSMFTPSFGLKHFGLTPTQKRFFEIEIIVQNSSLIEYLQAFLERLSPQIHNDAKNIFQSIYRYQGGGSIVTMAGMLNQIFRIESGSSSYETFEHFLTEDSYSALVSLAQAARCRMPLNMEQVIGQILSCPYQKAIRRDYLKGKALELVSLYLEAMGQPHIRKVDIHCIYQAAAILRKQLADPPTVEGLARLVGTNRLKLNQGFREVFGTTPFDYSRTSRLYHARRLLMTSDLPIIKVANAIGYTCHGKFAVAFRQQFGINPKAFQMQAWQCIL